MKRLIAITAYLPFAGLLLHTVNAQPAYIQLPLEGTIQSVEVVDFSGFPTAVTSTAAASGQGTLLGQFNAAWEVVIDFTSPGGAAVGQGVYTAANGDSFFFNAVGHGTPTGQPNIVLIEEESTIVGGTGRFQGASGHLSRSAYSNLATGLTSGTFTGTILLPQKAP